MSPRARWSLLGAALALIVLMPGAARAQSGMGTFFSGPIDGDGAAPFWNPAAMSWSTGSRADVAVTVSDVRAEYDRPETQGASSTTLIAPQPFAGATTDAGLGPWRFGVSVGAPYVSGARWSKTDPEGEVTRYYARNAYIIHGMATPAVSYRISDQVAVGAGVDVTYSVLKADFDKDFATVLNASIGGDGGSGPFVPGDPVLAAPVKLRSAGFGVGAVAGVAVDVHPVRIGASVHSPVTSHTHGTVEANYPDSLREFVADAAPDAELPELSGDVSMDLGIPLTCFFAVAVDVRTDLELELDYRYGNYSSESNIDILISKSTTPDLKDTQVVKGTRDRHSVGARARYAFTFRGRPVQSVARIRYENNTVFENATTPNNADFRKLELGAGVLWPLHERLALVAQYTHVVVFSQTVAQSLHRFTTQPSLDAYNHPPPLGDYSAAADALAVALVTTF